MTLKREDILIEALPYIQKFHKSVMVLKVGGEVLVDDILMDSLVQDIVLLRYVGIKPVLVHGGGREITEKMERLGKKPAFVKGLRVTDDETLEITRMVLVGNVNHRLVSLIGKHGAKGVGLSGKDGRLIEARKQSDELGWVGDVASINAEILEITSEKGYIPVVSPIGVDREGNSLNINADIAAGEIAAALSAERLLILTDVNGVLKDVNDPESLIPKLTPDDVFNLINTGVIEKGMIPKVNAALHAVAAGVKCHIINGKRPHSILLELFTDQGVGTMIEGVKK
ncbi:MAG: acetylglutamate kinase [Candidatus Syntrophoarchaeum caldarius]|uniref:Acetylglutamate kinase n=1 Tax=Candidatus Syntropharchaeum caldarium TaxID=1838285 RepID=A0A1F2P9C9_9EURY|nr:MAG: acetylglutamate kinase [Candidatus Syntrophoarchaeum caldarius]